MMRLFWTAVVCLHSFVQAANSTCNGHASLCAKAYSNVTFVGAHNSASVGTSISDNQHYSVSTQLDDGVRLLQGQGHNSSSTTTGSGISICHSSCALQDGGTLEKYLEKVTTWVKANPSEVITILWVNSDNMPIAKWAQAYESSGLKSFSYVPAASKVATWPTLQSLIDAGTTVVSFITSEADFASVPYILPEWTNIWETPFEVTDYRNFTCDLNRGTRPNNLYMANHFAYSETTFLGTTIDSPDTDHIEKTNSLESVFAHGELCMASNNRYPNFFLVDYYEKASGGALQAAAKMNGVSYTASALGSGGSVSAIATFFGGQNMILHIAAVSAGAVAAIIILWVAICCICKRKSRRRRGSATEGLIKPVEMSSFREPEVARSFANRLSQQPSYAPVYNGGDSPKKEPMTSEYSYAPSYRSRADSQSSLMASKAAFDNIRGGARPAPTRYPQTSYTSYSHNYAYGN